MRKKEGRRERGKKRKAIEGEEMRGRCFQISDELYDFMRYR